MLSYNGINLNVNKLHSYQREAVYSGKDYVHTKYTLVVTATLNPGTGAYTLPGRVYAPPPFTQPPVTPVVGQPTKGVLNGGLGLGVWTDEAVRSVLMAPRKTLRYDMDGQVVLFAPLPGFSADAFNGPKPIFCNVTKNIATKTFMIDYGIEVYLNECNLFSSGQSPLVSYQWEMEHTVTRDFFSQRVIRGRAVFRSDIFLKNFPTRVPDDMRKALFHPVPAGFQRSKIYVKAREDSNTLDIVIIDEEKALNISPAAGVTHIEGLHSVRIFTPGTENQTEEGIGGAVQDFSKEGPLEPFAFLKAAGRFSGSAWGALPRTIHKVTALVWGGKNSTRNGLTQVAINLVSKRLASVNPAKGAGYDYSITHDYAGKMVTVENTIVLPPVATGFAGVDLNNLLTFFPLTDDTGTIIVNSNQTVNPTPIGDGISRGSYIESLATAILQDQCARPSVPPPATRSVDYTSP